MTRSVSDALVHREVYATRDLIDRRDLIGAIENELSSSLSPKACIIKGPNGIGKTTVAREYAWRHRERYSGVWWICGESRETVLEGLSALAAAIADSRPGVGPMSGNASALAVSMMEQSGVECPWLLVFDDIENAEMITDLVPRGRTHVLVTSPNTRCPPWGIDVFVRPLDAGRAVRYLIEQTNRTAAEMTAANGLVQALGCTPLLLGLAAAYCRRTSVHFDEYRAAIMTKSPDSEGPVSPLPAVVRLCLQQAAADCPESEFLAELLACFAPDSIPLALVSSAVMSEQERNAAAASLVAMSILEFGRGGQERSVVSLHDAVKHIIRSQAAGTFREIASTATLMIADAIKREGLEPSDRDSWLGYASLLPHLLSVTALERSNKRAERVAGELLNSATIYLLHKYDHRTAERMARRFLEHSESFFGEEDLATAAALSLVGGILQQADKLEAAELLARRSLAIMEKSLGADDATTAVLMSNLAGIYRQSGRLDDAERLLRRSFEIVERAPRNDHDLLTALDNLSSLLLQCDRVDEGAPLARISHTILA
jgi:hypothetical protein